MCSCTPQEYIFAVGTFFSEDLTTTSHLTILGSSEEILQPEFLFGAFDRFSISLAPASSLQ